MSRAVLVTRAVEQGERSVARLRAAGFDVTHVPCIELAPPPDPAAVRAAAAALDRYDWLVLTSQNAVARLAAEQPPRLPKIAAIGPETARAVVESFGREPDLQPAAHRGEALAAELLRALAPASRLVLVRAERARDVLPDALIGAGHQLDLVVAYSVRPALAEASRLADFVRANRHAEQPAWVLFASSATVDAFVTLLDHAGMAFAEIASQLRFACISPITARALAAHGGRATVIAREYTLSGLLDVLGPA